jgi:hypothetical protein
MQLILILGRVKRMLLLGGGLSEVGGIKANEVAKILGAYSGSGIEYLRFIGIEPHIGTLQPIEEFKIADQWRVWNDILSMQSNAIMSMN